LERFLRHLAKLEFLVNSEEFLLFSRPNGDVEKNLSRLTKIQTATVIDRMHKSTDIKERMYDLSEKERFNNTIIEFSFFAKKVLPQLKVMKKSIQQFQSIKTSSIANQKGLYNILNSYEGLNLTVYVEHNPEKQVLNSD
jgi:hypothetical protein